MVPDAVKLSLETTEYEASGEVVKNGDRLIKDDDEILADPLVLPLCEGECDDELETSGVADSVPPIV